MDMLVWDYLNCRYRPELPELFHLIILICEMIKSMIFSLVLCGFWITEMIIQPMVDADSTDLSIISRVLC